LGICHTAKGRKGKGKSDVLVGRKTRRKHSGKFTREPLTSVPESKKKEVKNCRPQGGKKITFGAKKNILTYRGWVGWGGGVGQKTKNFVDALIDHNGGNQKRVTPQGKKIKGLDFPKPTRRNNGVTKSRRKRDCVKKAPKKGETRPRVRVEKTSTGSKPVDRARSGGGDRTEADEKNVKKA